MRLPARVHGVAGSAADADVDEMASNFLASDWPDAEGAAARVERRSSKRLEDSGDSPERGGNRTRRRKSDRRGVRSARA
jgi:hypothetical protein